MLIAEGSYKARAGEHVWGRAGTGTEQVVVDFEIQEGEFKGQHASWRGFFTDGTQERTLKSLERAGWDGKDLVRLDGLGSKDVNITIEHEENNEGKRFHKVAWVNSGGNLSVKSKMTDDEVRALQARLTGRPAPKKTDDVPF
jgi:hypothetical protein